MTGMLLAAGAGTGLLVGVAALVLRALLVVVTVRGRSMEPALHNGDRILVRRTPLNQVRRGQIVVFRLPQSARGRRAMAYPETPPSQRGRSLDDQFLVKRAVALPGDPVPGYCRPALVPQAGDRVPAKSLVVVGDNAAASFDSRNFGYVTPELVLGIMLGATRAPAIIDT